ncbi:MAG: LPXTG cell wall anchor domain-containing protein, partial [Actinobacteria bacterium]|nr:LPXTG cell wall anchor domain-containing protein [Actinomycetota bacterium]
DMAEDATAVITVQVGVLEFVNTVSLDCLVNNSLPLSLLSLFNKAGAASPPAVLGTSVAPAAVAAAAAGTLPRTGGDSGLFIAAGLALATLGLFAGRAARQAKAVEAGILS